MAKALTFSCADRELSYQLGTKVEKKALYGHARRIAEKDGRELARGVLLPNGRLLPNQALSLARVDPLGTPVEPPETLIDGAPAELKPSSFDIVTALEPVPISALTEFAVRDVYPLEAASLGATGVLDPGVYRCQFAYKKTLQPHDALVLQRSDGLAFLLTGVPRQSTFLSMQISYSFFDADEVEEDQDELDFSMV